MKTNTYEQMQRALDQIEAGLSKPLNLAIIAESSHFSPFHFARHFRAVFDDSVMNYVWKRRLSHAAHLLKEQQCSVIDTAMECGFGSSEAFSRAFRKHYNLSPSTYQRNAQRLYLPTQRKIVMSKISSISKLTPTLKELDGFFAIECGREFLPGATNDIGQLWESFMPRIKEVHTRVDTVTYGICSQAEDTPCDPDRFFTSPQLESTV